MRLSFHKLFVSALWVVIGFIFIFNPNMPGITVQLIGALLTGMGLYSCLGRLAFALRTRQSVSVVTTTSILQIILGACMLLEPDVFVKLIIYICGGVLLFVGYLLLTMFMQSSFSRSSVLMLVAFLLIALGSLALFHYQRAASIPFTLLGLMAICKGVGDIVKHVRARKLDGGKTDDGFDEYEEVL